MVEVNISMGSVGAIEIADKYVVGETTLYRKSQGVSLLQENVSLI